MAEFDSVTTTDDVLDRAAERTGIAEIDSDSWRPGLAIVLHEVNTSPAFTPHGRDNVVSDCISALARRMRMSDYLKSFPEVLETPVTRPLFVLGMPRTGTTVISNLLDQDPARRSLLYWECMDPVPPPATETLRTDPRCLAQLEEQRNMLAAIRDANISIPHWDDADAPVEDMFIHNQDFKGLVWDAYMATPRYAEWLINEADMSSAYQYQKRYLQVLQSKAPGVWSLKMPSHSVHIDTLLDVFPDARLIWAHRDPYKAAASLGNLWKLPKMTVLNADAIDPKAWGGNVKAQLKAHVQRPLRARERVGEGRFFDMYYHEMMADPLDVIRRIYDWAGDPLTPDVQARMRQWLGEHPQDRFAPYSYSLDEYNLTVDELNPLFAEYLDTFDIELEGPT